MDLSIHLHELQQNSDVGEATQVLLHELKKRFKKITDPGDSDHEPLFLVATALDPRYKLLLNPVQRDSAKKELLMTLKQEARGKNRNSSASEGELTSPPLILRPVNVRSLQKSAFIIFTVFWRQSGKKDLRKQQVPHQEKLKLSDTSIRLNLLKTNLIP